MKLAALLLLSSLLAAHAADLTEPVVQGSKITYADLLRHAFPGLKVDRKEKSQGTATKSVPIRQILGSEPPRAIDSECRIDGAQNLGAKIEAKGQVLVEFSLDEGDGLLPQTHLALFDLSAAPKLLDLIEVPGAPDGPASGGGGLTLAETLDGLIYEHDHHNSSQGYHGYVILYASGGRIQLLESVQILSCNGCGSGTFREEAKITTAPDPSRGRNQVVVQVTLDLLPDPPEMEHRKRTRASKQVFKANYRWNAAKKLYEAEGKGLSDLNAFNDKNY